MRKRKKETPLPENYHFPPELLNEVLLRLPVKTLLRFRCVCKSWCSLIDSSDFIHTHLNVYPNNLAKTQLLVEEMVPKTFFHSILTVRRSHNFRKTGQIVPKLVSYHRVSTSMVDGLMLMDNVIRKELSLWNPSIRRALMLPYCPFKYDYVDAMCHLGFAPLSSDYKVVFFKLVDFAAFALGVAVYSYRDHKWRVKHHRLVVSEWCFEEIRSRMGSVFAQGAVYLQPSKRRLSLLRNELVCFDFDDEEFSCLELPEIEAQMYQFVFALGGSLALLCVSSVTSCIWIMEKSDGTKLWQIYWKGDTNVDIFQFFSDYSYIDYEFSYIEDTGKLLIQSLKKLMAYDFRRNQAQCLGKSIPLSSVETYVESLVLHKGATLISHG